MDRPGIHSICVNPQDSANVSVGVSCGGMWTTFDRGKSWELRADGMRAEYMPPDRANDGNIQDPHRVVRCPSAPDWYWAQHHNGIFKTEDAGKTWSEISNPAAPTFGFAVAVHPADPRTAWFVPAVKDEKRIPANRKLVVTRTRDGGKTFDVLDRGLPDEWAYHLVFRHALDVDETGDQLVFGSTTGSVWFSQNQGDSWDRLASDLPPVYCARFG